MRVRVGVVARGQWDAMRAPLTAARVAAGVTQETAAVALGVPSRTLRNWERDYDTPKLGHLIGWAYGFGFRLAVVDSVGGPGLLPVVLEPGESFVVHELRRLVVPLWNRRRAAGLSQQDLAVSLGVSRSSVVRWETAAQAPLVSSLIAWSHGLGCEITLVPVAVTDARGPVASARGAVDASGSCSDGLAC